MYLDNAYLAMNDNVKIPKALVKRINRVTAQVGVTPGALVKTALANQLDYEEWFLKAVDAGIADLDAGRTFSTCEVLGAIVKQRNERIARERECSFSNALLAASFGITGRVHGYSDKDECNDNH